CMTRYVVPDTAIGPEGRTVRCAKCQHSWFQEGPELVDADMAREALPEQGPEQRGQATATAPAEADKMAPASDAEPASGGEHHGDDAAAAGEDSTPAPAAPKPAPPRSAIGNGISRFDAGPPFPRRRNRLRL